MDAFALQMSKHEFVCQKKTRNPYDPKNEVFLPEKKNVALTRPAWHYSQKSSTMIARSLPARFTRSVGWGNGETRRCSPLGKNQWHNSASVRHWSAPPIGSSLSALPLAARESPLMLQTEQGLAGPWCSCGRYIVLSQISQDSWHAYC